MILILALHRMAFGEFWSICIWGKRQMEWKLKSSMVGLDTDKTAFKDVQIH